MFRYYVEASFTLESLEKPYGFVIGPLHDPVTWNKSNMIVSKLFSGTSKTNTQIHMDWTTRCIVLAVPMRNLLTSICDLVPCDQIVHRAYSKKVTFIIQAIGLFVFSAF